MNQLNTRCTAIREALKVLKDRMLYYKVCKRVIKYHLSAHKFNNTLDRTAELLMLRKLKEVNLELIILGQVYSQISKLQYNKDAEVAE